MSDSGSFSKPTPSFKPADQIPISVRILRHSGEEFLAREEGEEEIISLAEKIDQYLVKLGYSSAHVLGIVVNLMTNGKIRVEFRNYSERLELADMGDKTTRSLAVATYDAHLSRSESKKDQMMAMQFTGKIVVQSKHHG